ncbi:hypothetical protein L1887_14005 [Cichorium endivia]|nr:hypothetical protein L1887_14005 [Cichorium endivia]
MTSIRLLHILIAFALFLSSTTLSLDSPEASPSPAREISADDLPPFPSLSPLIGSPDMSPPADLAPTLASSPTLGMSPAPKPVEATNTTTGNEESDKPKDSTSRELPWHENDSDVLIRRSWSMCTFHSSLVCQPFSKGAMKYVFSFCINGEERRKLR